MTGQRGRPLLDRLVRRPLAPRLQLLVAPAVYYLATPGLGPWQWPIVTGVGLVPAGLGLCVLRGKTVAWLLLSGLMSVNLLASLLGVTGLIDGLPLWVDLVGLVLAALVLQALLAVPVRPRPQVWDEIVHHRPLLLFGALLVTWTLLAADVGSGEASTTDQVTAFIGGLAVVTWVVLLVRAVRRSRRTIRAASGHAGGGAIGGGPSTAPTT